MTIEPRATADLVDVNMIDPFHLEAYGETAVNYNRDILAYPLLTRILEKSLAASLHTGLQLTWESIAPDSE